MKTLTLTSLLLCGLASMSTLCFANADPLVGKWKTIDARTGFSLSDVVIQKAADGTYNSKIVNLRPVPGAIMQTICSKCSGEFKNKPLVGFPPLANLRKSPNHESEFIDGIYVDPRSGLEFKTKAKLNNSGKILLLRNTTTDSISGQNLTWIKY